MESTPGKTAQNPFSPTMLNQVLKKHLNNHFGSFWLTGEIFEIYKSPAGHQYFTLKDSQAGIKCVMFKQKQVTKLNKGSKIMILGNLTMYTPKGDIQVNVLRAVDAGEGDLAQQFIILKQKLQHSGLFDKENKKLMPAMISSVGVITSPRGAALQDVLNIFKKNNPLLDVILYPTPVQGEDAAPQINHALRTADEANHDVLLLTRGGGSKEDLWVFNDEFLAHQLAQLNTPVISAIGHETDESISDLVADYCCITPSAAAHLICGDFEQKRHDLVHKQAFMKLLIQDKFRHYNQQIDAKSYVLQSLHPTNLLNQQVAKLETEKNKLNNLFNSVWQQKKNLITQAVTKFKSFTPNVSTKQQQLTNLIQQTNHLIQHKIDTNKQSLNLTINDLNHNNPLNVLDRGFSITTNKNTGAVITTVSDVKNGDEVITRLKSGRIHAKIFERLEK